MADVVRSGLNAWQFKTNHTQDSLDILDQNGQLADFVSAESVVLCAGPASYSTLTGIDQLIPIGLCDSVGLQQNTNIIQLFEVGSRLPYLIPGRTYSQLQLNRVVFNGDSLMGALTAGNGVGWTSASNADAPGVDFTSAQAGKDKYNTRGAFLLNLASSFFKKPFGLALLVQDSDTNTNTATGGGQWVAGLYAENCYIQNHQMNIQGQQFIVMESASVRVTNLVPMSGIEVTPPPPPPQNG